MSDHFLGAPSRYSRVAVLLHWTMAMLIITTLTLGLIAANSEGPLHRTVTDPHKALGMVILILSLVRLGWRLAHRPPPHPPGLRPWERRLAGAVHHAFYVLIIAIPTAGWVMSSAYPNGHPIDWLPLIDFPFLPVGPDKALSSQAHTVHQYLAWSMLALLALHLAAVVKHQLIDRDGVLGRMSLWGPRP